MNIILFGTGEVYRKNKSNISKKDKIVAFLDNDAEKQGKQIDGIYIYSPSKIQELSYEKIVIMSEHTVEMKEQLLSLGCKRNLIVHHREYLAQVDIEEKKYSIYLKNSANSRNCVIITYSLGYHGGALAVVYAALELMNRGYEVSIVAVEGDDIFIQEYRNKGIEILIYPILQYANWEGLKWILEFKKVIVNTYCMILSALEIAKYHKVSLWLHESNHMYTGMVYWKDQIVSNNNLDIYAVSEIAKDIFIYNNGNFAIEIMPFGIPDMGIDSYKQKEFLSFAVIGSIYPPKQQLVFLEALTNMDKEKYGQTKSYIVGKAADVQYAGKVEDTAGNIKNVYLTGELQRDEMDKFYEDLDVVVVSSVQETMSMTAVEAMMRGKICIVGDNMGIAGYIQSEINGLVYKTGDIDDLTNKLEWCVDNRQRLSRIGKNARIVYEQYFTMEMMGERLEKLK